MIGRPCGAAPRYKQFIDFVRLVQAREGVAPSYGRVCGDLGIGDRSNVRKLVIYGIRRGHLSRADGVLRAVPDAPQRAAREIVPPDEFFTTIQRRPCSPIVPVVQTRGHDMDGRDDWCILRTQAAHTLGLAKALGDAGYRAWTPTEVQVRRARRAIPRKEVTVPLMPALVFAEHARLVDLIGLARSNLPYRVWDADLRRHVVRGLPHFSVLRYGDRYARVSDDELTGLRRAESIGMTLAKIKTFRPGVHVRVVGGAGEGLRGVVESVNGTFAKVRFPAWTLTITVAFHLLEAVEEIAAA